MKRFELIDALEGRFIPTPKGDWLQVIDSEIETEYSSASLMQESTAKLELLYQKSRVDLKVETSLWWATLRPHFNHNQLPIGMIADMVGRQYTKGDENEY